MTTSSSCGSVSCYATARGRSMAGIGRAVQKLGPGGKRASIWASACGRPVASRRSACPTIARQSRLGPCWPLALIAAVPLPNSASLRATATWTFFAAAMNRPGAEPPAIGVNREGCRRCGDIQRAIAPEWRYRSRSGSAKEGAGDKNTRRRSRQGILARGEPPLGNRPFLKIVRGRRASHFRRYPARLQRIR